MQQDRSCGEALRYRIFGAECRKPERLDTGSVCRLLAAVL